MQSLRKSEQSGTKFGQNRDEVFEPGISRCTLAGAHSYRLLQAHWPTSQSEKLCAQSHLSESMETKPKTEK